MQRTSCNETPVVNVTYEEDASSYNYTFAEEGCESYYFMIHLIHNYIIPVIVLFGLIGNLLAATIFLTTKLKSRSSSVYLGVLSVADFGFLAVLLVANLSYANIVDLYNINFLCQIFVFLSTVCSNLSVWLIVAFTAERFIAVKYPFRCPQVCTTRRAKIITACIACLALISQAYIFWTAGIIIDDEGKNECEMLPEYREHMRIINYVDTVFALVLPLVIIVVLNVMIARSLIVFKERLFLTTIDEGSTVSASTVSTDTEGTGMHSNNFEYAARSFNQNSNINIVHYERKLLSAKSQRNITKMLLLISTVFVFLHVPSYVLRFYTFTLNSVLDLPTPTTLWCLQQLAMTLFYMNYSINFLLYSMCAATFRKALILVLHAKLQKIIRFVITIKRKFI